MTTTFSTAQLDFETIKENLKIYLKKKSEFADYNFEASGLSNILDVLAYNTHLNALMTNFALNESYLSSAQLRSSVITIAQMLGYSIRSRSSSTASLNLTLNLSTASVKPASITLPAGIKFSTSVNGVAYTFQTFEPYTATNNNGIYEFVTSTGSTDIPVYEGTLKRKTFIVQTSDERQVFIIPDETIDTQLVEVKVYDTYTSTSYDTYTDIFGEAKITTDSKFYKIYETPNGYYELNFGDGVTFGRKPTVGNKIVVDYISCVGADANGATSFTPVSQVTVNNVNYNLGVVVASASYGGAPRQSIESIRANAPLSFASQQRLVTAEDYKTTILTKYSSVDDVVAWGGEDNDPPNYGVVYCGLLFKDGVSTSSQNIIKDEITSLLNENLAILSIDISFIDPVVIYLNPSIYFNFNPALTKSTQSTLENVVLNTVQRYVDDNLKSFSGIFRKSNLASAIDDIGDHILSTEISVTLQQRLTPITAASSINPSQKGAYSFTYPVALADPDDENYIITSSTFYYNGYVSSIKNELNSTKLQVVDINGNIIVDNIGSYTPTTGKIDIVGFAPGIITSGESFIKLHAKPANDNTIKPLRNYYLDLDTSTTISSGIVDRSSAL